jgi:hypothetical protein
MQSSLAAHVGKMHTLEGAFAAHDAIKQEVGLLRQLAVEKSASHDMQDHEREREQDNFGGALVVPVRMTTTPRTFAILFLASWRGSKRRTRTRWRARSSSRASIKRRMAITRNGVGAESNSGDQVV